MQFKRRDRSVALNDGVKCRGWRAVRAGLRRTRTGIPVPRVFGSPRRAAESDLDCVVGFHGRAGGGSRLGGARGICEPSVRSRWQESRRLSESAQAAGSDGAGAPFQDSPGTCARRVRRHDARDPKEIVLAAFRHQFRISGTRPWLLPNEEISTGYQKRLKTV
jgi:hypothetical protein